MNETSLVITSIFPEKDILQKNINMWPNDKVYIVMDKKSSSNGSLTNDSFILVDRYKKSKYESICPYNSYSRKNIGYIEASKKTKYIFETDDDNLITDISSINPSIFTKTNVILYPSKHNLFREIYSNDKSQLWPRGFPLSWLERESTKSKLSKECNPGVIQFLVNGNPDVDAIYRLVMGESINLEAKKYSSPLAVDGLHPFNSQATMWRSKDAHLMYLPSTCSFRMTDIYRGYIAGAIFFSRKEFTFFDKQIVNQQRNEHSIVADFKSEHAGYLQVEYIVNYLENDFPNETSEYDTILKIYNHFIEKNIFDKSELNLVSTYLESL